jgi:hypothetical protein
MTSVTLAAALAVAWFNAAVVSTQTRGPALASEGSAGTYSVPRTPWGHPDLQGTYSNKYEQGTPMERPEEFKGRSLRDISGDELARVIADRKRRAVEREPFLAGDPTGQIQGNPEFRDQADMVRGSRAWMVIDPADGRIPALTPEAQKAAAARRAASTGRRASSFTNGPFNSVDDFSLYDRCITRGFPSSMLPAIYGNSYEIVQSPTHVAIRYEMVHETRVIPLASRAEAMETERPHVGDAIRLDMGDARGYWDGDTLVVVTRNFRQRSVYNNANPDSLRIVERFSRTSPASVEWSVTVDDPKTWTTPWTFTLPLTMTDSEPVLEYACHEGNYAVRNMLSASRAEEKAAAGTPSGQQDR